jgi:uncharacterized membrane protein (DUF485 family)
MALCGFVFSKNTNGAFDQAQGWPALAKTISANERKALFWYKWLGSSLVTFAFYGHAVFMFVVYLLVMFWPPYQKAFIVTNWIANILQHSIFGVLAVISGLRSLSSPCLC